ncbi:beta-glucosidase family protein [Demequina globuliformis]|uniref:beta-glucosidase family protein n=1 Tax=Demequina globuliformis TaxID=676202 RepID=UPI0007821DEE|nr:beta-glucosidase [Demequina globuliformis]
MSMTDNRRRLISDMTLADKASLMSGANFWNTKAISRLGVPSIMLTDGPHGLRKQGGAADHLGLNASLPATCFPTAATLACSWSPELVERVGAALGAEAASQDVHVVLGPGLNIKRNPAAGRNFEYYSEDPLVSGTMAASMIRGIQSRGVAASAKHFAVNSQETHRMTIDEVVDERALHEIYLEGFRIAVRDGQPWTVMSSYNRVNGTYANENPYLLQTVLRDTWGFDGLVVTDWGGNNDRVAGLEAGNALEMPSTDGVTDAQIAAAVQAGTLREDVLDERVAELLTLIDRTRREPGPAVDLDAHHALAIEAARRSVVLLRNEDNALPLTNESGPIAVIGDFAARPRYQGAGSSLVNPARLDDALGALRASALNIVGYEPGFTRRDRPSPSRRRRAVALARQAATVLVFLGLDESAEAEGVDRRHIRLAQNQLDLMRELANLDARVVVVLAGGAPVELPFAEDVDAIVHGYLGGQGGGPAIVEVLTGVNPSGRLAESYPLRYEDVASSEHFGLGEETAEHRESLYVGYRHYDKAGLEVRYPFGHGLSYTTFAYSDLEVDAEGAAVRVTNTGRCRGTETVQAYVEAPEQAHGQFRAMRELRGFAQVELDPGESATVRIEFSEHAFDVYVPAAHDWRTVGGEYRICVGASSRDIRLHAPLAVQGSDLDGPMPASVYVDGRVERATAADFESVLGRDVPDPHWDRSAPLTRADLIIQTRGRGGFASVLYCAITGASRVMHWLGRPIAGNNVLFALELPFRSVSRMSGGRVNEAMLDGFLLMVNRHFWRGTRHMFSAWRAHRRAQRAVSSTSTTAPKEG